MGREAARAAWESSTGSRPSIPVTLGELQGHRAGPGVSGPSLLQLCARRRSSATRRWTGLKRGEGERVRGGGGGPGGGRPRQAEPSGRAAQALRGGEARLPGGQPGQESL